MGQTNTKIKQNIRFICNVVADNPSNTMLIWKNQDMTGVLPVNLDKRYDLDVAPMLEYIDFRYNGAITTSAFIYNILKTKFNHEYLPNIYKLHFLSVEKFYSTNVLDLFFPYKVSIGSMLDTLKHQYIESEKEISSITCGPEIIHNSSGKKPILEISHYYVPKDVDEMKKAIFQNNLILCNIAVFPSIFDTDADGTISFPGEDETAYGMIACVIVGYTSQGWILRFPFGYHWGDNGYAYVTYDYFERFNRDRWVVLVDNVKVRKLKTKSLKEQIEKDGEEEKKQENEVDIYRWRIII
jgi:hypothetical protein